MEDILKSLIALGPGGIVAGLMFYLWKEERSERRELAARALQIATDAIEAEKDMTAALAALGSRLRV